MKLRLFCLAFLSLLLPAGDAGAQQVKLRANLQSSVFTPYGKSLVRFKEEVERRSGSSISIEIFDKAQLYHDEQVVEAVSSGAVEIGATASQQFVSRAPAVAIIDLPFLFNFKALVNAAASRESRIRKLIDEAILAKAGVRVLWWQPLGDTVFHSKGRDVADPARLKDQRVAVPGKALEGFVTRCGGRPTSLSVERFQETIEDGRLDMAMVSLPALQTLGLWKVTDTVTYTAHAPVEFFLIINERVWQSLSQSHRAIIAEVARAVETDTRERLAQVEAKVRHFASAKGIKVQQLTPDQIAEWRACSAEMLADYMDKNGELAHRLMAAYAKLRTEPCCMAGPGTVAFTRR